MASNRARRAEANDESPGGILSILTCGNATPLCTSGAPNQCDFDKNPTDLYVAIHTKRWDLVAQRAKLFPGEASTWVYRKADPNHAPQSPPNSSPSSPRVMVEVGEAAVRWRMLPIHAAVIFEAPAKVIRALLEIYPQGCKCRDDQGMLPLHLAFRTGSSEEIVIILLGVYPEAVEEVDQKGRLPSILAEKSVTEYSDALGEAFIRGPSYYYYAVKVGAADRVANESKLGSQLQELELKSAQESYDDKIAMEKLKKDTEEAINSLEVENQELKEKMLWYETKYDGAEEKQKVLVDHTNSLAERLRLTSLSEEHLATKLAKLEARLSTKELEMENYRSQLFEKADSLDHERNTSSTQLKILKQKLDTVTTKLDNTVKKSNEEKVVFEKERTLFGKQIEASKECLLELISSAKVDKELHKRDTNELKQELATMRSELKSGPQVPKELDERFDELQKEIIKSRSCASSVVQSKTVDVVVNDARSTSEIEATPYVLKSTPAKKNPAEGECELYVSTSTVQTRDDDGTCSIDSFNLSEVDTAIALGDLTEEQRHALEMLDLSGGKDEITATLSKVPGLTRNQVKLLVDVASSLVG